VRDGGPGLLRKRVRGEWDEDFMVVPTAGRMVARDDERVLGDAPGP
jgi:hypothetical protein